MPKSVGDKFLNHVAGQTELVREIRSAKKKTEETGEKVIFHKMIKKAKPGYKFYQVHATLVKEFQKVIDDDCSRMIVSMGPRHGKQAAHSTPVLTSEGWKTHGELKVGDKVFHPSGSQIEVVALSPETDCNARVSLGNGETVECHLNHEWDGL